MTDKPDTEVPKKKLRAPFRPTHLTEYVPEEELKLLLAGIAQRLNAPVGLCEMRPMEGPTLVFPEERTYKAPDFCRLPWDHKLREDQDLADVPPDDIKRLEQACVIDEIKRAGEVLRSPSGQLAVTKQCHMGLWTTYIPIVVEGQTVACLFSGCWAKHGTKKEIKNRVREIDTEYAAIRRAYKKLVAGIPIRTINKQDEFEISLSAQPRHLIRGTTTYSQAILMRSHNRLINEVATLCDEIRIADPNCNVKKQTDQVLRHIAHYLGCSFIIIFCATNPEDEDLPFLTQIGLENSQFLTSSFSWQRANLPENPVSDLREWLRTHLESEDYPYALLRRGFAKETTWIKNASFIVPYVFAQAYRSVIVLGSFADSPVQSVDFLFVVLQVLMTNILSAKLFNMHAVHERRRNVLYEIEAHNYYNKLHFLKGEVSVLIKAWENKSTIQVENTERIGRAVHSVKSLLDDLGDSFSPPEQNFPYTGNTRLATEKDIYFERYSLCSVLFSSIRNARRLAEHKSPKIRLHYSEGSLPWIEMDPLMIRKVFDELLLNAIKYSAKNTTVIVSGGHNSGNEKVEVIVHNMGSHMPISKIETIFACARNEKMKDNKRETGLGLKMVYELIVAHGGDMRIESTLCNILNKCKVASNTVIVSLPINQSRRRIK
jgi:signal transduction histidine kinase